MIVLGSVISLVLCFSNWYQLGKLRSWMLMFSGSMILLFFGESVVLLVGWEGVSVMSMLLIGLYGRNESKSASVAAVMYNRMGDIGMMVLMFSEFSWILVVSLISKSALLVCGYWLPMAMEGPTPVSSLLHSSTMVVASVYLGMKFGFEGIGLLSLVSMIMLGMNCMLMTDVKKVIALSTSLNLLLCMWMVSFGYWAVVMVHIGLHAFLKASMFVKSSINIHVNGGQGMPGNMSGDILMGFIGLMGISVYLCSKEMMVLESGIMGLIACSVGYMYSNSAVKGGILQENGLSFLIPYFLLLFGMNFTLIGVGGEMLLILGTMFFLTHLLLK